MGNLEVEKIRGDFPMIAQISHGFPLAYLDSAATALKPKSVIDALDKYYTSGTANVHRGIYQLSEEATALFEAVRDKARDFIKAQKREEIIFTRGTTDGLNLLAFCLGESLIQEGDEILLTQMEHHSNIVPWQLMAQRKGAKIKVLPITESGELDLSRWDEVVGPRTKIFSFTWVSNTLGTVNPIEELLKLAKKHNLTTVVDGAQAAPHLAIDVKKLDMDYLVFSGHKIFGPTGIGVLYGKEALLEKLPPYQGGGDMIDRVTFEETTYNTLPYKFEAGTPPIAQVIGLGAAIDYLHATGMDNIEAYEHELSEYAEKQIQTVKGLKLIGMPKRRAGVFSFTLEGIHPQDIGSFIDQKGMAIRTGHHCTQPLMDFYNISATARASFAFYNTKQEVDQLVRALSETVEFFTEP